MCLRMNFKTRIETSQLPFPKIDSHSGSEKFSVVLRDAYALRRSYFSIPLLDIEFFH